MAMNLPCKVHGCDSVIQSWPKLNPVQQAVLPGVVYQANTLHGHQKCFEIAVDFTVQRVHIFKMSEHGPKRNMGPVGDLFCGGRQAAFVNQRRQRAHNFLRVTTLRLTRPSDTGGSAGRTLERDRSAVVASALPESRGFIGQMNYIAMEFLISSV